jgi:hypothetical protein
MRDRFDWLDTQGGHIVVSLFVFLAGAVLLFFRPEGKEVMSGGLVALWASLRNAKEAK